MTERPLAPVTVATLLMHDLTGLPAFAFLAWFFIGILYVVVVYLIARKLYAVTHHQICVEGH